ncbi:G2/mitotic-specific cyclin [Modicella reniformis]|uniref:G2/mitotic-specific cyclin n=1 Tax=Modicella reniformis TaxID=1440133 RepID=A0A9P6IK72_9FUNG|nr:G2/mitotic-specific cyclin [Modicella reniformis]
MSQINRSRAALAGRRTQNDENVPNVQQQPPVTYVKDVVSSMQASTRSRLTAASTTVASTGVVASRKRVLVEKTTTATTTNNNNNNNNNYNYNNISSSSIHGINGNVSISYNINNNYNNISSGSSSSSTLIADKERVLPASTTEAFLPLLEGEDEAQAYEEEVNRKRPRREEYIQWDDSYDEDTLDPLMVSEYSGEIYEYMLELEIATMPDPNYILSQKELHWAMRGILIDWLAEVHYKFKLLPETLFLSVNVIDRFLSLRAVSMAKLQLVGVTALFIAAKYEEVMAPSVQNFIFMADGGFKDKEILQAERYMLQTLGFQLSYPSPMNFLRRISKADNYNIHSRTVAKYLMEIPLLDPNFLEFPPSMTSGAALCLARRMIGHYEWHDGLVLCSGYMEEELMPCMELMVYHLQRPLKANSFIFRKYSTKRFLKASIFCREWVINVAREIQLEQESQDGY